MAILKSCCCALTVRKGSYASAIYTLIYFGCWSTMNLYDLRAEQEHSNERIKGSLIYYMVCMTCYVSLTLSSFVAILGLYKDQRKLLLPWIFFMFANISLEIFRLVMIWFFGKALEKLLSYMEFRKMAPIYILGHVINMLVLCLNVNCLLCVITQFQGYGNARSFEKNRPNTDFVHEVSMVNAASNTSPSHLYPDINNLAISEETQSPESAD